MPTKTTPRVQRARALAKLMAAMDRCAIARGEAQWMNGYRAKAGVNSEDSRLYAKEQAQWREVDLADAAFRRLAIRVLRSGRATP